jgi:hypothetical protein
MHNHIQGLDGQHLSRCAGAPPPHESLRSLQSNGPPPKIKLFQVSFHQDLIRFPLSMITFTLLHCVTALFSPEKQPAFWHCFVSLVPSQGFSLNSNI